MERKTRSRSPSPRKSSSPKLSMLTEPRFQDVFYILQKEGYLPAEDLINLRNVAKILPIYTDITKDKEKIARKLIDKKIELLNERRETNNKLIRARNSIYNGDEDDPFNLSESDKEINLLENKLQAIDMKIENINNRLNKWMEEVD